MNFAALSDFITVIRHGGFGKAARATDRPKPTLSRRVRELEEELGVRLIERSPHAVKLTDEGLRLFEKSESLLAELKDVFDSVGSKTLQPRGRLRISAPVVFATAFLGKSLSEFAKAFPEVMLEVIAEDRAVDLFEERYDAVIRINPKPNSDLVGRCIARDEFVLVASPKIAPPVEDAQDEVPAVLSGRDTDTLIWKYRTDQADRELRVRANLRVSTMLMVREAVLAGIGAAVVPRSLVHHDLAAGTLHLWGVPENEKIEFWILHRSRRLESERLRVFIRFLEASFKNKVLALKAPA